MRVVCELPVRPNMPPHPPSVLTGLIGIGLDSQYFTTYGVCRLVFDLDLVQHGIGLDPCVESPTTFGAGSTPIAHH